MIGKSAMRMRSRNSALTKFHLSNSLYLLSKGYKRMLLQVKGDPPEEWLTLQRRILAYQRELNELGIKDYQVVGLDHEEVSFNMLEKDTSSQFCTSPVSHLQVEIGSETRGNSKGETVLHRMNVVGHIIHLIFIIMLAALPAVLLNLPVGLASRIYSNRRRKIALAASKVKVKGYDVMLSERVLCSIVLVPTLWLMYGLALMPFLDGPSLAVCFTCFPLFSYWSIMATERYVPSPYDCCVLFSQLISCSFPSSGMADIKDLRPYMCRLFPSTRKRLTALPATRKALRNDLIAMIRSIGPSLGEIYFEKELNWQKITTETKKLVAISSGNLDALGAKKDA